VDGQIIAHGQKGVIEVYFQKMERSKVSHFNIIRLNFIEMHHTTPEEAQVARAIVEENLLITSYYLDNGLLTEDRIDEIADDDNLQQKFERMWELLGANNNECFKQMLDNINQKADIYCGWLDFYNERLAAYLNLNLIPFPRSFYRYQEFLGDNSSFVD
jgi:hypothetical protein